MATMAQIEANRRNAQKSTGPKTEAGKQVSRLNALDHGGRALLPVLPGETSGEYERQLAGWRLSVQPRNPSEQFLIERIVSLDLQSKRIERAQTARISRRMHFGFIEEGHEEVRTALELGQELFRGTADVGSAQHEDDGDADAKDDELSECRDEEYLEEHPTRLVHTIGSTGAGCQWLLEQWGRLHDLIKRGLPWIASDQHKAVRLLGHDPIDAIDESDVALVYLAGHVLLNDGNPPFQYVLNTLAPHEVERYERDLNRRGYEAMTPKDAPAARQVLMAIAEKAIAGLEEKADVFRHLFEADARTAVDRLSWDDTPEGERLRRYELRCKRDWQRMFDLFLEVRRTGVELEFLTVECTGRLVATEMANAIDIPPPDVATADTAPPEPEPDTEPLAPNEANSVSEKAPNEPNFRGSATTVGRSDGQKEFRIDTPRGKTNGTVGKTASQPIHLDLHKLEFGYETPLLNLSPIFGKA